jgi:xylulokinase
MWLSLDIGTSGVKAALLDDDLTIRFRSSSDYPTHTDGSRVEQNVKDWWLAACETMQELNVLAASSEKTGMQQVTAIAITGQMQDLILLADGAPVRPVILYSDSRAVGQAEQLQASCQERGINLTLQTGNEQTATSLLAKWQWLLEHEPDSITQADTLLLGAADVIVYKLTGKVASDTTTASTTGLMDIESRGWLEPDLFTQLDLPHLADLLPTLVPGGTHVGSVTAGIGEFLDLPTGTPVYLAPGDAGATTLGTGSGVLGKPYGYIGTSGWWAFSSTQRGNPTQGVFTLAHPQPDRYLCIAPLMTAGQNLEWFTGILEAGEHDYDTLINRALTRPITPLIYLPYLNGERSPFSDPTARGCFIGLNASHTREDMLRAVLEGVIFAYQHALTALVSPKPDTLILTGGGSQSSAWCQLMADVTGVAVLQASGSDSGVMGAVLAAQVMRGDKGDYGLDVKGEWLEPHPNTQYENKYQLFLEAYTQLAPLFPKLNQPSDTHA